MQEQDIRAAFNCQLTLDTFRSDGYAQLKWKLSSLDDTSAKKWLPLVLIQELQAAPTSEGDAVVYFLDGNLAARRDEKGINMLREAAQRAFSAYTREQARVILSWLEMVARPNYGNICGDDVESAIDYWRGRVLHG